MIGLVFCPIRARFFCMRSLRRIRGWFLRRVRLNSPLGSYPSGSRNIAYIDLPSGCQSKFQAYVGTMNMSCMNVVLIPMNGPTRGAATKSIHAKISQNRFAWTSLVFWSIFMAVCRAIFAEEAAIVGKVKVIRIRSFMKIIGIIRIQVKLHLWSGPRRFPSQPRILPKFWWLLQTTCRLG